jgi:putative membrane protein
MTMMNYGWFGGFGMVFMWLFWIGVIALSIWLITSLFPKPKVINDISNDATALEILQRRYARGEVTPEAYADMRRDLEDKSSASGGM